MSHTTLILLLLMCIGLVFLNYKAAKRAIAHNEYLWAIPNAVVIMFLLDAIHRLWLKLFE